MELEGGLANVVWLKDHGHYEREIKVKGVVLPGRALAGQKRRQHMKEKENIRHCLQSFKHICRVYSHRTDKVQSRQMYIWVLWGV